MQALHAIRREPLNILLIEDTEADIKIAQRAFTKSSQPANLVVVQNGQEAMKYLRREDPFCDQNRYPGPDLILLDINMPKMNGFEFLETIKKDSTLCSIPVIVLTTSKDEAEIKQCYSLGAASFISKPVTYEEFLDFVDAFNKYWSQFVKLPSK